MVKIDNYKSIGSTQNSLLIEPQVTALIGKNESGKSNVLEAIGTFPFLTKESKEYFNNKNRGKSEDVAIFLKCHFNEQELEKYKISQKETELTFLGEFNIRLQGGLSELLKSDISLIGTIKEIVESKGNRKVWSTSNDERVRKRVTEYLYGLELITTNIYTNYKVKLNYIKDHINNGYQEREELIKKIDAIIDCLEEYYGLFPKIYYREKDRQLNYSYKFDDIKKILQDKSDIFYRFLLAAEINEDELIQAFQDPNDGVRQTIKRRINRKIKENIEDKFNEFYTQEHIEFLIEIENKVFKIYILTDDKAMVLTERSNGLRWYLSLFVDILSQNYAESFVLFLLDERFSCLIFESLPINEMI